MVISRSSARRRCRRPDRDAVRRAQVTLVDNGYLPGQLTRRARHRVALDQQRQRRPRRDRHRARRAWRSGPLAPQERYQRRFAFARTYDYAARSIPRCAGRMVVQP